MTFPTQHPFVSFSFERREEYLELLKAGGILLFDNAAGKRQEVESWLEANYSAVGKVNVTLGKQGTRARQLILTPANKDKAKTEPQDLSDSKLLKKLKKSPPPSRYSDRMNIPKK